MELLPNLKSNTDSTVQLITEKEINIKMAILKLSGKEEVYTEDKKLTLLKKRNMMEMKL